MDAEARQRLMFEKAVTNNQRRQREQLLSRLPVNLAHVLGDTRCIYSVDLDATLQRFLACSRSGMGTPRFMPPHDDFAEVAWEEKMLAFLSRLVIPRNSGKAFLLLQSPTSVKFDGREFCVPESPLFVVDFCWAASILVELWNYSTAGLFLIEVDIKAGALIDTSCGILPEDPNPREIGYEVGLWPAKSNEVAN
jgi:hypothetical protein